MFFFFFLVFCFLPFSVVLSFSTFFSIPFSFPTHFLFLPHRTTISFNRKEKKMRFKNKLPLVELFQRVGSLRFAPAKKEHRHESVLQLEVNRAQRQKRSVHRAIERSEGV
ncbi:hypothetical protein HYU19_01720 [Candidatus Woesearchaeota archaeon]|nr:hypothetical protein [Candidatus Woesearchaeota archaeon]